MNGWLIVNNFVNSKKSQELRGMLMDSAKYYGIDMQLKRTGELLLPIGGVWDELPDFAVFWDKDIALASRLEACGLRLFNSSRAVALCDNKGSTYIELARHGIKFPTTYASPKTYSSIGYSNLDFAYKACEDLGYPVIVKEAYGSFGQQVYLAHNGEELAEIIAKTKGREFVLQRFIAESSGRDVRVNVVGEKAIGSMYRYNDKDFRSNISNGGKMKPYTADDEISALAVAACKALELDFGGVDILFAKDGATVCEVNSNPHFKSTFDCTGIDMSRAILGYIKEIL